MVVGIYAFSHDCELAFYIRGRTFLLEYYIWHMAHVLMNVRWNKAVLEQGYQQRAKAFKEEFLWKSKWINHMK